MRIVLVDELRTNFRTGVDRSARLRKGFFRDKLGRPMERMRLLQTLTTREWQIAFPLCKGHSNKQIARQLDVTEGTVKNHLHSIYRKLGVTNRTALTALVIVHLDHFDDLMSKTSLPPPSAKAANQDEWF